MRGLGPVALLATWERGIRDAASDRALTLLAAAAGCTPEEAAGWDVGSRDAVLATLLTDIAGATAWGCTACTGCGEQLDVPVDLMSMALSTVHRPGELLETETPGGLVSFRLPTTEDLRAVSDADPVQARHRLLARCTRWEAGPIPDEAGPIPDDVAEAVDAAMEASSPTGAVELAVGCPHCGATTRAALDVALLLWAEVEARAVALLHDVHALAAAYGWTEPDVLALSPTRRAAYLEMAGR